MEDLVRLKEELSLASRILANEDLAQGFGHISVRLEGTDKFLIPCLMSPDLVTSKDILTINLAGKKIDGEGLPNGETWIHTCIYRVRPDVMSVSHFHSFYVKLLGIVGQSLKPVINSAVKFADGVPIYMDPELIITEKQGAAAAQLLGQHHALMLRAHGVVVVDEGLKSALISSVRIEETGKMQVWAGMIGKPLLLTPEEIKKVEVAITGDSDQKRAAITERLWNYYLNRLPSKQ
ncbi:MAG: class II aldolase/adducin family protein [Desulfobacterales bacterium]|nr:class II aldolase/adducin family protein [Desulfobacterales bacterium]